MPRCKFISFADSSMVISRVRIFHQAKEMGVFDEVEVYDEHTLFPDMSEWRWLFNSSVRGFGYWCWKPYVILRELKKLAEGDCLVYMDAGCHFNVAGRARMNEYLEMLKNDTLGVIAFKVQDLFENAPCIEQEWTKRDVLEYFGCSEKAEVCQTVQIAATHVFCRKSAAALEFVDRWNRAWQENIHFADDSPSVMPNAPGFKSHRHDQSLFSVLFKLRGGTCFPNGEVYAERDWSSLASMPIWDLRDRGKYKKKIVYRMIVYRLCTHLPWLRKYFMSKLETLFREKPYLKKLCTCRKLFKILLTRQFTEKTAKELLEYDVL